MSWIDRLVKSLCPTRLFITLCVAAICGCAGGGGTTGVPSAGLPASSTAATRAASSAIPPAVRNPSPAPQSLCVGGTRYVTTQDDEFSRDSSLNYSPDYISQTPQPSGAIWSSKAAYFSDDGARNNIGTDDAFYTDPTRGFGGYSPYSFSGGALHIKTVPVPAPYATAPALDGAHWLSGLLEGPGQTYGYVEINARVPNLQGFFPAALWLLGVSGDDGKGDGYEELDVNELFGIALPLSTVQQTQTFSTTGQPPSNYVRTLVSPDPGKTFHTYGVLWTPSVVRFFIDRKPTSVDFPNAANGPANAIINLGVFTQNTWSPGPLNQNPETMDLHYYRWYQTTTQSCSPSIIPT